MERVGESVGAVPGTGESRPPGGVSWPPKTRAWMFFAELITGDYDDDDDDELCAVRVEGRRRYGEQSAAFEGVGLWTRPYVEVRWLCK